MDYSALISTAIVAVGWYVTSHQANKREDRKETRAEIDALVKTIESTTSLAIEYYSNIGVKREKARGQLMPMLERIETRISVLQHHRTIPELESGHMHLWDAITDGDFDSESLPSLPASDVRILRIITSAENLIFSAESWYCETYKRKKVKCEKIDMR